jgi:hypothetical protein
MSSRSVIVVDDHGRSVGSPDGNILGFPGPALGRRVMLALPTNGAGGGPSIRYSPPWAPGDFNAIGIDMSLVIPAGIGIQDALFEVLTNSADFAVSPDPSIEERSVYVTMAGGVSGTDYQLKWTVSDSQGFLWHRTGLLLCALTS